MYFLHGIGGNELNWEQEWRFSGQIRREWAKNNAKRPTVVTLSYGPNWLLAKKNPSPLSGLFEATTDQVIPMVEGSLGGLKGRRILMGYSMGGFNAIQLALNTNLFDKVALVCAPVTGVSAYAPQEDITKFIESSYAWQYHSNGDPSVVTQAVQLMIKVSQAFFPTPDLWSMVAPLNIVKKTTTKSQFYITAGIHDRYAIYEGNIAFVESLKSSSIPVEWHPQWGDHCTMDIPTIADFLVK